MYVGSAVDLTNRFYHYYSLKGISNSSMSICKALLKYGYTNFQLEILEYCEPSNCIEREQYYLDLLAPEYNILKTAGSTLGYKHSEETKSKISKSGESREHTEETRKKIGDSLKGENNHMYGKKHTLETLEKMSAIHQGENNPRFGKPRPEGAGKPSQKLQVFDRDTNVITLYSSISEAAEALNIDPRRISMYFSRNQVKPYKKRYIFTKISSY